MANQKYKKLWWFSENKNYLYYMSLESDFNKSEYTHQKVTFTFTGTSSETNQATVKIRQYNSEITNSTTNIDSDSNTMTITMNISTVNDITPLYISYAWTNSGFGDEIEYNTGPVQNITNIEFEDMWHDGLVRITARVPYIEGDVIIYTLSQGNLTFSDMQIVTPLRKLDVIISKSELKDFNGGNIDVTVATLYKTASNSFYYNGYSEAGADPYIQPVQGELYKLPDASAYYRLLQTDNIMINVCVEQIDQKYINSKLESLSQTHGITLDIFNFTQMFFFTKMCIIKHDECVIYDMLKQEFQLLIPSWIREETGERKSCHIEMYTTESVHKSSMLYINEEIVIESVCYENPQIMTGIKLLKYPSSSEGLLLRKFSSKSAKLESLYAKDICEFTEAYNSIFVKEIFHTNGNSKIHEIEIV
jgi:hypothetical protein